MFSLLLLPIAWLISQTLQIRVMAVTANGIGKSPIAAEWFGQIPKNEAIASSTGYGAHARQPPPDC